MKGKEQEEEGEQHEKETKPIGGTQKPLEIRCKIESKK